MNERSGEWVTQGALRGVRVLVVDDQPEAREVVAFVLEQAGARVAQAESGIHALEVLARTPVHVVVSDIGMPRMDGFTLAEHLRARPASRGGAVPAIALTGYISSEDRTRAMRAGFQAYLNKPVEPQELIAAIASVLRGRQAKSA